MCGYNVIVLFFNNSEKKTFKIHNTTITKLIIKLFVLEVVRGH